MIRGRVTPAREAVVEIEVSSARTRQMKISAVIDTGYNGSPTLPQNLIARLQLPRAGHRRAKLGDGSSVVLPVYIATVEWHGARRDVLVLETEGATLLGMALLMSSHLGMDVTDQGEVRIDLLP